MLVPVGVAAALGLGECDGFLLGDLDGLVDGFLLADGDGGCDALRLAAGDADRDGVRLGFGLCAAPGVEVALDVGAAPGEWDGVSTADGPADRLIEGRDGRGDRDGDRDGDGEGLSDASVLTMPVDPWPLPLAFSTAAPIR